MNVIIKRKTNKKVLIKRFYKSHVGRKKIVRSRGFLLSRFIFRGKKFKKQIGNKRSKVSLCLKNPLKKWAVSGITLLAVIAAVYFNNFPVSQGASYTFTQTNWAGGATANNATHTSNQTGWTEYSAKDTNLTTVNAGADLQLVSAPTVNEYTIGALADINVDATAVTDNLNGTWTITLGAADLSRIFKNDKFKDEASPQKSWKILSSFDSANKIIVWDSEGNGGAPSAAGATQATVGRWYASISLWEDGRDGDLVARSAIERGLPYYDVAADTTGVTIDGWTTDATHYIEIYVPLSERHRGVWDGSRYYMNFTNATAITINVSNVRIEGLQISLGGGINGFWGIGSTAILNNILISKNIIRNTAASYNQGVNLTNNSNTNINIWNNIIYLGGTDNGNNVGILVGNGSSFIYSNTTNKGFAGIAGDSNTIVKNNIVQATNVFGGFSGTFHASSDYNISDLASDAPGANSKNSTTVPFVDSTNKDFHLEFRDGAGNPAMNAGADLSADPNLAFTTDIDGDTRSGTWDIGADDVGATLVKVHSIGTASRNFSTLQNWETARDGVLTTRNVFKISTQSAAFTEGETITGTSGATGTYIKERDTPSATETYMTVDKVNATAFVAGDTLTGGTSLSTATLSTILTTAGTIERGEAYNDGVFTLGGAIGINGSTTDSSHYMWLTVEPRSRHKGVAETGAKINITIAWGWGSFIVVDNSYTIIEWFEFDGNSFTGVSGIDSRVGNLTTRNNLMYDMNPQNMPAITGVDGDYVYNNIIYNVSSGWCIRVPNWSNSSVYNNTTYNCATGISRTGIDGIYPTLKNNLSVNNTTDYSGNFNAASSNNLSSDATAPGANSLTSQTLAQVAFVSTTAGMEDFHILPASVAKDAGTSLSSTFTTDIDNQTRPVGSTWDIGADETSRQYQYPTSAQTLTSSAYNSTDTANVIGALSWTEDTNLPTGTTVTVSLRTATSSANLTSASWNDFTNATANCSKATGVVTCSLAAIPAGLKDGTGDQWFQYKVTLTSTGANTPTFSNITLQYVVNAPPQFDTSFNTTGTTAVQNSDGTVTIQYQIRDPDTTTGTVTPNAVTPSFEYSTNGGSSYSSITSGYLGASDLTNKTVGESSYTLYSATWNPKAQLGSSTYVTNAKIRVTLNDNEAANNTANAATANFTLDTTNPVLGTPSLSINPNAATPGSATLTISATDNSSMQMKIGLASDLSDASWETYNSSKTITLATDPDTVYYQFKDAYSNTTSITSAATPETPTAMMIQDTSNLKLTPAEYRLFSAWKVIATPSPGFKQYNVYRSTDNTSFTQIATITNVNTNYYGDSAVVFNQTYYYKVSSQDQNNNISFYSSTIQAQPDGIQNLGEGGGGADGLPPTISAITSSNIQTTQATITWTTDELSNSTVGFSIDTSFTTEQGVTSYVTSHSVTLTNLTPNTAYKFQVKSVDPTGNLTTDNNSSAGYTFTTANGPAISNVTVKQTDNTQATIVWRTDIDSSTYVTYGTAVSNGSITNGTEVGTTALIGGSAPFTHTKTLTNLTQGTQYYFSVKSIDSGNNTAVDNNGGNFYQFTTTVDTANPVISGLSVIIKSDTEAAISWTTDEPATSQVKYSLTSGGPYTSTTISSTYDTSHYVILTSLTADTPYYYKVVSNDINTNSTTSSESSFTTKKSPAYQHDPLTEISAISDPPSVLTDTKAVLTFDTDQASLCIVESGTASGNYTNDVFQEDGYTQQTNYNLHHSISLNSLLFSTKYYYQITCEDNLDNAVSFQEQSFTTTEKQYTESEASALTDTTAPDISNIKVKEITGESVTITWETDEEGNSLVKYGTTTDYGNVAGDDTVNFDSDNYTSSHTVILYGLIPSAKYYFTVGSTDAAGNIAESAQDTFTTSSPSSLSYIQVSSTSLGEAAITWRTSKETSSIVEYGKSEDYGEKKESTVSTRSHEINLSGLETGEMYHFRVKGEDAKKRLYASADYTFIPKSPPRIGDITIKEVKEHSAIISFTTDIPTDALITYTESANEKKSGTQGKPEVATSHDVELKNLSPGTKYFIKIKARDIDRNESEEDGPEFVTGQDALPPKIDQVRTDSALTQSERVQTIISWTTDEPSTTVLIYKEGRNGEQKEAVLNQNYSLTHIAVITSFKPGTVYYFKAKSIDESSNTAVSGEYALLTPKRRENIIQVIVNNFQDIFSWVKR